MLIKSRMRVRVRKMTHILGAVSEKICGFGTFSISIHPDFTFEMSCKHSKLFQNGQPAKSFYIVKTGKTSLLKSGKHVKMSQMNSEKRKKQVREAQHFTVQIKKLGAVFKELIRLWKLFLANLSFLTDILFCK